MATPSRIATAVSADRSLRVKRPRRTTFLMIYARAEDTRANFRDVPRGRPRYPLRVERRRGGCTAGTPLATAVAETVARYAA
jgi:hypothetical protein